ncbi:MAG: hypothetical protein A2498_00115 [Lentisphaerae bacterium RIFOXYC12_FULL_60_16]|nr:MAG: hypothetical protein A2498_00115 [Lentisphaerae bacterium RIFOXYC12_FULL_60_16]OGV73016.1 MAG: hypothetical protein A2269_04700 [Lentisphaerae bacterium RIFOXYA12_FULL_60_10]
MRFTISSIVLAGLLLTITVRAQEPVIIIAEGETFTVKDDKGWKVTHQDDSYASHTYGGMWVSQGGLMGAPADSEGSIAVRTIQVPAAGAYRIWSKYQSLPYYNYPHQIEILQNGKPVFSHVYGKLDAERLWSFSAGLMKQLWWFWGPDHDAAEAPKNLATLAAGPAEIRLTSVKGAAPAADPMIDFIVLTTEPTDTYKGLKPYGVGSPFCLEASAATELYIRFKNNGGQPVQLSVVKGPGHFQPNYGGWNIKVPDAPVAAGQWSSWYNLGTKLTLVHDEGVYLTAEGNATIEVQFALDSAGKNLVGDLKVPNGDPVVIPMEITWSKERQVKASREYARELVAKAKKDWRTANSGKKPQTLLYYGAFNQMNTDWAPALKDALGYNTVFPDGSPYAHAPIDGYHQHCHNSAELTAFASKLGDKKSSFKVMSFGDEIHLGTINWNDPANQEKFTAWIQQKKLIKDDLGIEPAAAKLADRATNPRLNWYATMFNEEVQFATFRDLTAQAKQEIGPQVETGANYSPHVMPQYYGPIYQWIDIFKHNGMTMYWAEDYVFSVPQPPQFISWMFSTVRCAVKYNQQKIHFYIMPHAPGQIPANLRRGMVFAIGAGANSIDNFWVAPAESFTENFVAWGYTDMFRTLHESIYDSAEAEPFQVGGTFRPARVAIVISKATDHNERLAAIDPAQDPFMKMSGNAPTKPKGQKRAEQVTICRVDQQLLYLALKQDQHAVDLVTEDDVLEGRLKAYDAVYFAGTWIDHRLPAVLEKWVTDGGMLYACAGLGIRNEFDEADDGLTKLLGLKSTTLTQNALALRTLMELPLAPVIDTIKLGEQSIPAIAMRQELEPADAKVLGTWPNGKAAVTVRELGKGKAFAVGTAAGHTYYKTGLKTTPWPRGGRKVVYNPTAFDAAATELALLGARAKEIARDVQCSNRFVEALVIDQPKTGTLLTLVNWDNQPLPELTVEVKSAFNPKSIRSVEQQKTVPHTFENGVVKFTTALNEADYFLLAK